MTYRHLKIYKLVCELKSVTLAANNLYLAQPAVSQVIKELEQHYSTRLFDRISRKLYLTDKGRKLYEYAFELIALYDEIEQKMGSRDVKELLRIGSSITVGNHYMPDYVKNFKSVYPEANINVFINSSKIIEQKILNNELDFALIEGTVHSPQITSIDFMEDRLAVICSSSSPLCKSKKITLNALLPQPFLLREKGSGTREWFDSVLVSQGYSVTPVWESTSTHALINAVINDLGISVLPFRLIENELKNENICILDVEDVNFKRFYHIIYHRNKYLNDLSKKFIDTVKESAL